MTSNLLCPAGAVEVDRRSMAVPERHGADRFVTYRGDVHDRFDPKPEDHRIEEIALSLSNITRFGGYLRTGYVVGEHSIHVAETILRMGGTAQEALCGLMHDSPEGPFADVLGPLKVHLPDYCAAENRYMASVAVAFGLPYPLPPIVHMVDKRMAVTEGLQLLPHVDSAHWLAKGEPIESVTIPDPRFAVEVELTSYMPGWLRDAAGTLGIDADRAWPPSGKLVLTSHPPLVEAAFLALFHELTARRRHEVGKE